MLALLLAPEVAPPAVVAGEEAGVVPPEAEAGDERRAFLHFCLLIALVQSFSRLSVCFLLFRSFCTVVPVNEIHLSC
jgi:hypothetical protein